MNLWLSFYVGAFVLSIMASMSVAASSYANHVIDMIMIDAFALLRRKLTFFALFATARNYHVINGKAYFNILSQSAEQHKFMCCLF